jgi:hypothetical protein
MCLPIRAVSIVQVGAFERGKMNLTLASLHLLAQTLGVKIVDLFKGIEE